MYGHKDVSTAVVLARMRRLIKTLGITILLLGSAFFFVGGPYSLSARSAQRAWDLGHLAFFLVATVAWLRWGRPEAHRDGARTWVLALVAVNVAGVVIEGSQYLVGRSASASDLFLNNVGAFVALSLFAVRTGTTRELKVTMLRGAALALLIWSLVPLYAALSDEYSASKAFPVLADFETPFQLSL
jgi:hypothetical protein